MDLTQKIPFLNKRLIPEPATALVDHSLPTYGALGGVAIEDDVLSLEGWATTRSAEAIEDFRLTCAGKELTGFRVKTGVPSPDVTAAYPQLVGSDNCRFLIHGQLNAEERAIARTSLITCTPLVGGREGHTMTRVIESRMPAPGQGEFIADVAAGFQHVSEEFLGYFIRLAHLEPDSDVLEVGCGVGRIAHMVAHYLSPSARYEGFDIVDRFIAWCKQSITPHAPNFNFQQADVYNKFYNPGGTFQSSEFRFPYEDESFDFLYLTSVFTHMMAPDVQHYIDEFHRVLRPGGRCLSTCLMLNDESEALSRAGKSSQPLEHRIGQTYATDAEVPEAVTGFKEETLLGWFEERGLTLQGKYYGHWCGRPRFTSFQDILIHQKPAV